MSNSGKYIVLEGPEGVGKTTQILELARRLRAAGLPVRTLREPDSQSDLTARALRQLTQDPRYPMNTNTEVLLYNAARSQSLQVIKKSVAQGIICLVDRNYLTTLAVQYYGRGDVPDYDTINRIIAFAVNGVEPDLCIVLDAPVSTLVERLQGRGAGERFDNLDPAFLERVRAGYLWEAKQRGFPVVFANENSDKVATNIWDLATQALAIRDTSKAAAASQPTVLKEILQEKQLNVPKHEPPVSVAPESTSADPPAGDEPYLVKDTDGNYTITEAGRQYLSDAVTDVDGRVYAFSDKLSPITIAAAMARLSRRGDDMRVTILDEFAKGLDKDKQLLQRVITAYGDDSVQQLAGLHVVVEKASNLLTKKLEWGRLAAYLEQSTRYIYYDQKDADGKFKYYVPDNIDEGTKQQYVKTMDQIFSRYSSMVRDLTAYIQQKSSTPESERDGAWRSATKAQACDAVRGTLPVATESTVGIFSSGQALEGLIMHLQSDELPEARAAGQTMLEQTRKVMPTFLERADKPDRGGAWVAYRATTRASVKQLAETYLPQNLAEMPEPITLTSYWPHNELDLVPDMLYEFSNQPLEQIKAEVSKWPYEQKVEVFRTYMGERLNRRHRPGRALEKAHYSWDIVCDYGAFRDLQRHRMVDDLEWQALTPRYGYDIPKLVEEAGLIDDYERCFELSLELYSQLQRAGYTLEAQYATLLGHRVRWKITYNAREAFHLHELRTSPQGHPNYRKLMLDIHQRLAEVHPLLAEQMKFVNKDEDPELTRLAAERYTQFKLARLDGSGSPL